MDVADYEMAVNGGYALLALASVATLVRFPLRLRYAKLGYDDLFNGLALVCLIGFMFLPNYNFDLALPEYWKASLVSTMLTWSTLWLVKASFLALCWTIFQVSPSFRQAWWAVTTYTFFAFFPPFLASLWQCGTPVKYADPVTCTTFMSSAEGYYLTVGAINLTLHISTELLILALPLVYIRKLQMSKAQKISAALVFFVVILTITTSLIRTVTVLCSNDTCYNIDDDTSIFEPAVAVLVCALPPYKILLSKFQKRKGVQEAPQWAAEDKGPAAPRRNELRGIAETQDSIAELERI